MNPNMVDVRKLASVVLEDIDKIKNRLRADVPIGAFQFLGLPQPDLLAELLHDALKLAECVILTEPKTMEPTDVR